MKNFLFPFSITILAILFSISLQASHTKYGQLSWECNNNGKYTFHFEFYIKCGGATWSYTPTNLNVSGSSLPTDSNSNTINQIILRPDSSKWIKNNYGNMAPNCGSATANGTLDCNDGTWQKFYYQSDPIFLNGTPPTSGWLFSWSAPCCQDYAQNVPGLSSSKGYTQAIMYKNPTNPNDCFDSSPKFIEPVIEPFHCNGELIVNFGAIDPESDSLVYQWEPIYYSSSSSSLSYASGYSYNNPLPDSSFNPSNRAAYLNPNTGLIDAKVVNNGDYAIAVSVEAWRNGELMSSVYRQRLLSLGSCANLPNNNPNDMPIISMGPTSSKYKNIKIKAGDQIQLPIAISDTNSTNSTLGFQGVKLFPQGSLFATDYQDTLACLNPPCATLSNQIPFFDSVETRDAVSGVGAATTLFNWQSACSHLTDSGQTKKYYFYFSGKDDHCSLPAVNHGVLEIEVEPLLLNGVQSQNGTLTALDSVDQYQWYDCTNDTIITGATSSSYTPTFSGDYAVILKNGDCRDTSACYPITTVGMEERGFAKSISYFPNPTEEMVNINLPQNQEYVEVKISNIHGQVVQNESFKNQSNFQLQLKGEAGIYFIEIMNNKGERTNIKVIKK